MTLWHDDIVIHWTALCTHGSAVWWESHWIFHLNVKCSSNDVNVHLRHSLFYSLSLFLSRRIFFLYSSNFPSPHIVRGWHFSGLLCIFCRFIFCHGHMREKERLAAEKKSLSFSSQIQYSYRAFKSFLESICNGARWSIWLIWHNTTRMHTYYTGLLWIVSVHLVISRAIENTLMYFSIVFCFSLSRSLPFAPR